MGGGREMSVDRLLGVGDRVGGATAAPLKLGAAATAPLPMRMGVRATGEAGGLGTARLPVGARNSTMGRTAFEGPPLVAPNTTRGAEGEGGSTEALGLRGLAGSGEARTFSWRMGGEGLTRVVSS